MSTYFSSSNFFSMPLTTGYNVMELLRASQINQSTHFDHKITEEIHDQIDFIQTFSFPKLSDYKQSLTEAGYDEKEIEKELQALSTLSQYQN